MKALLESKSLEPYKVGFVLDEGCATGTHIPPACLLHDTKFSFISINFFIFTFLGEDTDLIPVYYAERAIWQFEVKCPGDPGHGSRFIKNNAGGMSLKLLLILVC